MWTLFVGSTTQQELIAKPHNHRSDCRASSYISGRCWTRTSDPLLVRQVQNTPIFTDLANFWGKVHRFAVNASWISLN